MSLPFSLLVNQLLHISLQATAALSLFCMAWIVLLQASRNW